MTTQKRIALIIILLSAISFLHYNTSIHHPVLHILHRELYLIPIIISAYWFGLKGGLTASVISSIIYMPKIFMGEHISTVSAMSNGFELLTFNIVACLVGRFQDIKKRQYTRVWKKRDQKEKPSDHDYDVMVCIDNSPNALKTAQYIVDNFTMYDDMVLAVVGFINEPSASFFPDNEEYSKVKADNENTVSQLMQQAYELIIARGFPAERVKTKTLILQNESMTNRILDEQRLSHCDSVIIGGRKMSKAEEFVLGNVAIKLIREANFSVITVF